MVRFDVNDNYVSSSADPWTVPRRIGGTDGLPGEQPVMIFRRSLTKPAGSDLPVNGQIFESSGGPKWAISPPIGGSGRIWMCFAVWTYDSINSKYIQKTNWSDPTPFEAQDTRTIYAYHGPTNGDLIPSPPTDDPQAVYEAGMNYSKNGWTKTTRSDTRFKAEAYFNNGWSPWLITRQGGQAGKDGKDGSLWYLYETIKSSGTITKEADDKRGWFEANYGKLGDYAIKTTGEVYRRTDNPSIGRWTYALDLAQAWWAYDQLGAYQVASTSFRSSIGQVGDWTMKPDGTLYQKKTSVQWEKKGTMAFSISTDKLWAFDAYKVTASNGDPNYESWDFRLRRDTAGIVHYVLKWYRNGGSRRNVVFYIPDPWASQLKPLPLSLSAGAHVREMLLPGKIVDDLGAPITETPFAKIFYNEPLNRIELTATFINDHTCYCAGSYPADGVSGWG